MSLTPSVLLAQRQTFSKELQADIEQALLKMDEDPASEFEIDIQSTLVSIYHNLHSSEINFPPGYFDIEIHGLWAQIIACAKGTPADDTRQDELAMLVLRVRELGGVVNERNKEVVSEGKERLWSDLPHLVEDFRGEWERVKDMKPAHVKNLAAFTARLTGVGVCGDKLGYCMLQLCKQVLETEERPKAELLDAVMQWFKYCGQKLNRLTVSSVTFQDDAKVLPESLAVEAGVIESGFSVARWLFWRKRVKEFALSDDVELAAEGKWVFDEMMMVGRLTENRLPGEKVYWDKVTERMDRLLEERIRNGGITTVELEDIEHEIDLNWVDEVGEGDAENAVHN
jgi:hypothetical protein